MAGFMDRVAPVVNETIRALAKTKFINDPIAGESYSRATSIVSSAYKRHGKILMVIAATASTASRCFTTFAILGWVLSLMMGQALAQGIDGYRTDHPGRPLLFGDQYSTWHTDKQGGRTLQGPYQDKHEDEDEDKDKDKDKDNTQD